MSSYGELANLLSHLRHGARRQLLFTLDKTPLTISELVERTALPRPQVRYHIGQLVEKGLAGEVPGSPPGYITSALVETARRQGSGPSITITLPDGSGVRFDPPD